MWLQEYVLGTWVPTLVAGVNRFVVKNVGPTHERQVAWHVCDSSSMKFEYKCALFRSFANGAIFSDKAGSAICQHP